MVDLQDTNYRLDWNKAQSNAKSYVLIMEYPDSPPPRSCSALACVEYSCRNIVTSRKLKKQDGLQDLEGIRQDPTSTGKVGYMGLKPLKGDLEHHYYVQIFTFDIMFR